MTWLTIGCDRPERRATGDDSLSLAKVTCTRSLTIGQESFSVSGLRYVQGMGADCSCIVAKVVHMLIFCTGSKSKPRGSDYGGESPLTPNYSGKGCPVVRFLARNPRQTLAWRRSDAIVRWYGVRSTPSQRLAELYGGNMPLKIRRPLRLTGQVTFSCGPVVAFHRSTNVAETRL